MKFVFYTNSVSPHQLPLARELVRRLGVGDYRYIAKAPLPASRLACGWLEVVEPWISYGVYGKDAVMTELLESCEILLTGERCFELFEKRQANGLKTFYYSERWFKRLNFQIGFGRLKVNVSFPGKVRMLHPGFRRMARRFVALVNSSQTSSADRENIKPWEHCITVLPIGVHAWNDMEWLGVCEDRMKIWAYFVDPHRNDCVVPDCLNFTLHGELPADYPKIQLANCGRASPINGNLRILYVGRLVKLKHVDTIIKAVSELVAHSASIVPHLLIVGDGPERQNLVKLAYGLPVSFMSAVRIDQVRPLMRLHDVVVFASDASDGWGAVVSEALEEGVPVIGTYETGASATMLPRSNLFHAGDYRGLARILTGGYVNSGIGEWSAANAATRLLG